MAYINVADWTPDQVTDWLKGLDDSMYNYVYSFTNNEVGGRQLLNIRPYELEQLGMSSIGHQEIVLEAVENLRNCHYNLDKENLQFMALHVATAARSLHRQLAVHSDASKLETQILNDITHTIGTIKPLIGWLDRAPFQGQVQFTEIRRNMLRLGLVMATMAQRDRFAERPVEQIQIKAQTLERLANYIIQDITDPMLLQPASLNLVTLKKRESELGFNIESSYDGKHRVMDIKYNSPAHNSGKVEDGDEIVQINYQTVVGWQYKAVLLHLRESLPDVLLTLKKRPKHTKIYGQIYMQPYRLPSKKRNMGSRWGENLPSPRAGFLTVPDGAFNLPLSLKVEEKDVATATSDTDDSSCSDILTPTDTKDADKEIRRLYYKKPRTNLMQRRNTICGDKLLGLKSVSGVSLWHERKQGVVGDPASPSLRDKSISFGFGLEIAPRPTTCIGIASGSINGGGSALFCETARKKLRQLPEVSATDVQAVSMTSLTEKSKPGVSKVVRFDALMKYEDYPVDEKYTCNIENTILETFEPIPFADEEDEDVLETLRNTPEKAEDILEAVKQASNYNGVALAEAVNKPVLARRGRLDKSHSTPAYDNSGEESDTPPPAIEPRKEFLLQTPPVPPPRPRKQRDGLLPAEPPPPPPPKPPGMMAHATHAQILQQPASACTTNYLPAEPKGSLLEKEMPKLPPESKLALPLSAGEVVADTSELHTPTKSRSLTLKKKHSLIAKRRNVNLKVLGTGEIQGHLYRRTKDRRGVTFWARLYFVMLDTILYGFRSKEAAKASCVIFLPGFTVSLAKEVHSKPFAFKVYHSAKTFYFATESQDALNQWVDFIRNAALQMHLGGNVLPGIDAAGNEVNSKDLFSETDSSGEENESLVAKNLCTPSPQSAKDTGTVSSMTGKGAAATPTTSIKPDRRYLGSLRKLTKGTLPFKSSSTSEKKLPVPTDQYRSYRKVPGGSFGIQIGTNTPGYHDATLSPYSPASTAQHATALVFSNASAVAEPVATVQRKLSVSSSRSSIISSGDPSSLGPPSSPAPTPTATPNTTTATTHVSLTQAYTGVSFNDSFDDSPTKSMKKIPYNFIHASNPNLVEFDFQTSKTLDYSLPKINPSNSWDVHQNIQGFMTLEQLMLQKKEEDAQEMYNNRVLLGVEKKDERKRYNPRRGLVEEQQFVHSSQAHSTQFQAPSTGRKLSKTQSRSLPKTPDYEISFKPDDEDIKKTRTKEGLKLRDFGYELISGDEPLTGGGLSGAIVANNVSDQHAHHQHYQQQLNEHHAWPSRSRLFLNSLSTHKNKKHSSNSCSSTSSADFAALGTDKRVGSLKKKGKASKSSSEHLFQFSKHTSSASVTTMTLPLHKKTSQAYEGGSAGIKKSHTYNNDLKEKAGGAKYEAHRKNSAPIFGKLSFSSAAATTANGSGAVAGNNKVPKEKRLLGSPLLRRNIFGGSGNQQHSGNVSPAVTCTGREYDREIFSQVILPKVSSNHHHHHHQHYNDGSGKYRMISPSNANITAPDVVAPPPPSATTTPTQQQTPPLPPHEREAATAAAGKGASNPASTVATPEYPNMECPPVFEPEIYSLTDPNPSLNLLLLRRNNNGTNDEKQ